MAKQNVDITEKELQLVTGVKRKKDEDEQTYLGRLVQGIADLPEAAWNKLGEPAQAWFNAAAEAVNDNLPKVGFATAPVNEKLAPKEKAPVKKQTQDISGAKTKKQSSIAAAIDFFCIAPGTSEEDAVAALSLPKELVLRARRYTRLVMAGLEKAGRR